MSKNVEKVWERLKAADRPLNFDELRSKTGLSARDLKFALFQLLDEGVIEVKPNRRFGVV